MSLSDLPVARRRLLEAAVELALERGPGALTGRALTSGLGASPSAVNYHFGGLAGLAAAVHAEIAARQEAWRIERLERLDAGAPGPAWAFVAAAIVDQAFAARRERLALLEFAGLSREDPALRAAARDDLARQAAFWRAALERLGATPEEAETWGGAAFAVTPLAMLDEDPVTAFSWLAPALLRLEERQNGRASPGTIPWLASAERRTSATPRPVGAQRLVDAALKVIAEQGLHATTLRAVAEAAGLSLGSTTYFFPSKAAIIHAAFNQLREEAGAAALRAGAPSRQTLSWRDAPRQGASLKTVNAIEALMIAGARSADLRPAALALRSFTGQTSATLLTALGPGRFDRLDGFVASLIAQGVGGEGDWICPPEAQDVVGDRLTATLERLFPPDAPAPG
jgi:AcrR family transcriptional regulator